VVDDSPKLAWRGLHVDTARHFRDEKNLRSIIRQMSKLKLSHLHWHLSDDQGWRLESVVFPELHQVGGRRGPSLNGRKFKKYNGESYETPKFHSQREVRRLVRYAAARGITIVPEVDLPAHAAAIAAAFRVRNETDICADLPPSMGNEDCSNPPAAASSGAPNCMGGTFGMIMPTAKAMRAIRDILIEVCTLFGDSPFFHIGGDEAEFVRGKLWTGVRSDLSLASDLGEIQADLMREIISVVASPECAGGKTAMVWDETVVELAARYVPEPPTIPCLWRDDRVSIADIVKKYNEGNVSTEKVKLIYTPKTRLYFDYLQYPKPSSNAFWPLQQPPPWARYKAVTLKRVFMTHAEIMDQPVVHGIEGCLWSELMPTIDIVEYQLFPRAYALSDAAWTKRHGSVEDLEAQYKIFAQRAALWEATVKKPRLE
jgi:hexosaminidase